MFTLPKYKDFEVGDIVFSDSSDELRGKQHIITKVDLINIGWMTLQNVQVKNINKWFPSEYFKLEYPVHPFLELSNEDVIEEPIKEQSEGDRMLAFFKASAHNPRATW